MPLLQRYAYANSNPANLVDPSGLFPGAGLLAQAKAILDDVCWKLHPFCKHAAFVWKTSEHVAQRAAYWKAYIQLESLSIAVYAPYYFSYYAARGLEDLPPATRITIIAAVPSLLPALWALQGASLGADMGLDTIKRTALRNDGQLNDEGTDGFIPGTQAGQFLLRWGINTRIRYLPGWHADDGKVDWAWGIR